MLLVILNAVSYLIALLFSLAPISKTLIDDNNLSSNMYLLTEWEGRTGKYLARGQGIRTERSEVRTYWPRAKYFPIRRDLTQWISILSYHHLLLKILKVSKFCLSLNRTRLHKIRQLRARNNYMKVSSTKVCHLLVSSRPTRNSQFIEKHNSHSHFGSCQKANRKLT